MSVHRRHGTPMSSASPSISIHPSDSSPFTSSTKPGTFFSLGTSLSTRQGRRLIVLLVAVLLFWLAYTQRLHEYYKYPGHGQSDAALPLHPGYPDAREGRSEQLIARPATNAPFSQGHFKLEDPSYDILILRSSIQHQDDTWRGTYTRNGKSWLIQTVAWLKVNNGVRPELDAVSAWCKLGPQSRSDTASAGGNGDGAKGGTKAEVKVLWTDYRDRGIDQDTLVWLECDATPLLRAHYGLSDALPSSFTAEQVSALHTVSFDFAFEHKLSSTVGGLETSTSGPVDTLSLWYTASDILTPIHKPEEKVRMTACLSPAFYREKEMPLLKWLEWREHMRNIGTERVVWYGREAGMGAFVDSYNRHAGAKDVFRHAPPLGDQGDSFFNNPYHDQDAWYDECILSHRLSTDFLFILDVDEYPMPDFSLLPAESLVQQWTQFLEALPEDRGCYEMTRIPMSNEKEHGPPNTRKLVQDEYSCVNGWDKRVKSFYRANTLMTANQHKKTRMYPIGEEVATKVKAKAQRPHWEFGWNSTTAGSWPKLFHYRWFSTPSENGCTGPSPLEGSEQYISYLESLRKDVFNLKETIEAELGLRAVKQ